MSLEKVIKTDKHSDTLAWNKAVAELHADINYRVLLLGSGGRESAMARSIALSPRCEELFIAPGNGGTADYGEQVDLDILNFPEVASFVERERIDIIVVGPEKPLVEGIADYFSEHETDKPVAVVGPSASAARLEGSKDFSKAFMHRHSIPTAAYKSFQKGEEAAATDYLHSLTPPYVLKADGLAAGKGVEIVETIEQAEEALREMLSGKFGDASQTVVIEQFLEGKECSVFVATDGDSYCLLPVAKDYKRIGDGDTGPNTGGMGSVSPVPFADEAFMEKVDNRIIRPTIDGLRAEGIPYRGFIFFGLMNVAGNPYLIEYNCRLGDPETESVLPRISSDFLELLVAITDGSLGRYLIKIDPRPVVSLVLASKGYPADYEVGMEITLPEPSDDVMLFHAGTKQEGGAILTNGGRVMVVSGFGSTIEAARRRTYTVASQLLFEGKNYRHDIAEDIA